jgi:hypothetical protein
MHEGLLFFVDIGGMIDHHYLYFSFRSSKLYQTLPF